MKVQGILVATVCLLMCLAGCACPGQTEITFSGESQSAESTAPLDDADFQQESAGFAPTDQMTKPFTVSTMEHQLGAYTNCNHGCGLTVIHPVYYRHVYKEGLTRAAWGCGV